MTGIALEHVLAFLVPLFLRGADCDQESARQAALRLLDSHGAATDRDLLLAAEIIAFSFTTLDNLSRSMADADISVSTLLRLRSNANALSRSAQRNRKTLEQVRKIDLQPDQPPAPPTPPPSAIRKVRDAIVEAAPTLAETLANASQTMSRQQRRFLMRKAEKARAAQEREIRKTARLAPTAAAPAPAAQSN
jgi:hypothetical protein